MQRRYSAKGTKEKQQSEAEMRNMRYVSSKARLFATYRRGKFIDMQAVERDWYPFLS